MRGPLAEPFLEAAAEGRLLLQQCRACGRGQLPPLARCEACGGTDLEWTDASGRASLVSFAVVHRAPPEHQDRVPYIYAVVRLAEGPRILTNIVHADPQELRIGDDLEVVFERRYGEQLVPEFRPAGSGDAGSEGA